METYPEASATKEYGFSRTTADQHRGAAKRRVYDAEWNASLRR